MKNGLMEIHDRIMLRKKSIIETVNDMFKNVAQIVHARHRNYLKLHCQPSGGGMAAYSFYDKKPGINVGFGREEMGSVKQLTLF